MSELKNNELFKYYESLKRMRSRIPDREISIQSIFPDVPYKGKWVKITVPLIDTCKRYFTRLPNSAGKTTSVERDTLTKCSQKALASYMMIEDGLEIVFVMQLVGNDPSAMQKIELFGEGRASYLNRYLVIDGPNEKGSITPRLGYGGENKNIKGWEGTPINNPTIGLYLYRFNIRSYYIFKPDRDSDYYGIVNHALGVNDEVI